MCAEAKGNDFIRKTSSVYKTGEKSTFKPLAYTCHLTSYKLPIK
jgi:hypothetical protein